jgi:hypothetical protein
MTNHIEQADKALDVLFSPTGVSVEKATAQAQLSQAHALIAIAKQLRIANLIALSNDASYGSATVDAESALWQINDNQLTHLQPDIAEALGIGGDSDD